MGGGEIDLALMTMKTKNQLIISMVPIYSRRPWASYNLYTSHALKKIGQIPGLLIAVALRYRYCSGATFTVEVAVAPILLAESSADSSAATFFSCFLALFAAATFKKGN